MPSGTRTFWTRFLGDGILRRNSAMKILLVNNDKGWGGGQEFLKALAGQLSKFGCVIHFLCRAGSPSERNFSLEGYTVYPMPRNLAGIPKAVLLTASLLRRERFDIVMITREHDLACTALAWKLAFSLARHGRLVGCYHTATIRRQPFFSTLDAVVCVSTHVRDKLLEGNGRAEMPVSVISNGIAVHDEVPNEKFTNGRQHRYFQGKGFPLIGMVGALFKNQAELIEMVPQLKRQFPSVRVAFVGDDSDEGLTGPIRVLAQRLGVAEHVIFTGKVPHDRMADVFFDMDLSVSTFRNEGFGLVHLESLAAGTPVVCYSEGGQVDIFAGNETGVLVEGGPDDFVTVVQQLLEDHERRFAMGRRGAELVRESFSLEVMGQNYMDLFKGLTDCI